MNARVSALVRWIERPRHERRVYLAARRVGCCEAHRTHDEWARHWLRRTRQEALAHHTQDVIDDWTMTGLVTGRKGEME